MELNQSDFFHFPKILFQHFLSGTRIMPQCGWLCVEVEDTQSETLIIPILTRNLAGHNEFRTYADH